MFKFFSLNLDREIAARKEEVIKSQRIRIVRGEVDPGNPVVEIVQGKFKIILKKIQ
jgi:hypothetical protein